MKKMIIAIACIVSIFSCKKTAQYASVLVSSKYQVTNYPKVYTRFGEITDKAIIAKYVTASPGNYFYLNADTVITTPSDTITYKSGDTVLFSSNAMWGTRIAVQKGQYTYFYMTDTLLGYKTIESPLDGVASNIVTFKPYYRDGCPSPYSGSCPFQEVYDAFIASGSRPTLELPLLTYKLTRSINFYHAGTARKNYNNIFDISVLNLLQDGDTLAIQTSKRIYTGY
jgi:hypothetical protein